MERLRHKERQTQRQTQRQTDSYSQTYGRPRQVPGRCKLYDRETDGICIVWLAATAAVSVPTAMIHPPHSAHVKHQCALALSTSSVSIW